jgi:hypothetical protein
LCCQLFAADSLFWFIVSWGLNAFAPSTRKAIPAQGVPHTFGLALLCFNVISATWALALIRWWEMKKTRPAALKSRVILFFVT